MTPTNPSRFIVGIDLGTTNCALSFIDSADPALADPDALPSPQIFPIPQVVAPGQVEPRPTLPSFLYLAAPREFPDGALDLPFATAKERLFCVGEFAQRHGVQVPMRLVSSAKSWLCTPRPRLRPRPRQQPPR